MNRNEIEEKYKWNLKDIYSDIEGFNKEFEEVKGLLDRFIGYKGNLLDSGKNLLDALKLMDNITIKFLKLYSYSNLNLHEDMSIGANQQLEQRCQGLYGLFSSVISFFEPELMEKEFALIEEYIKEENGLKNYKHYLENIYSSKEHILSKGEENILALSSELCQSPSNIYNYFSDNDMDFGFITNDKGEEIKLTHSTLIVLLKTGSSKVREKTFKQFYGKLFDFKTTFATIYLSSIKKDIFIAKARNYNSTLEMYLDSNKIPVEVYKNLIGTVNKNLHLMEKYMDLRKKVMKTDEIHMYDIYTPIVPEFEDKVSYEEAKEMVLNAVKPLGDEYVADIKNALNSNWIDVYENDNKYSGAYSNGIYGVHPYILMNYNNNLNDAFTLAHELGHGMHSYYSDEKQEYINSEYPIFLAEIASTVNEALLTDYLIKTETDKNKLKFIYNNYLEGFRGTIFRQTMFAEFELIVHEKLMEGIPLNVDSINEIYYNLNKKYYGNVISDDEIAMEWARIPHFYSSFYVYQYATGYSAAIYFAQKILSGDTIALDKYMNLLSSGGKDYPLELLKEADLNMASPEPIEEALELFGKILSKMEELI